AALREGLEACAFDIVARADADDISLPQRFEKQVPLVADATYDVVGAAMNEFVTDPTHVESVRVPPKNSRAISATFTWRNPMLHPTVVLRKSAVQAVGSYTEVPGAEDYWLWARMNRAGFIFGNLEEPLVAYRISEAYTRRGGVPAFVKDYEIQRRLYAGGVLTKTQWVRNMAVRSVYRFVPEETRKKTFRALTQIRKNGTSLRGGKSA
ncbi:MAG: glycosyltransferase, partial [Rothia sp. (in: high G+C Gram-positive bacteria)]|nr:glycosyltransferase [Rothia sp. (in: high G+C Gram-positive bacteria)]